MAQAPRHPRLGGVACTGCMREVAARTAMMRFVPLKEIAERWTGTFPIFTYSSDMTDSGNPIGTWCESEAEALRERIKTIEDRLVRYHSQSGSAFSNITEDMLSDARRRLIFVESLLTRFEP